METPIPTGTVPSGKYLFMPMVKYLNDYPCPTDWAFEPEQGESMKAFLTRTGTSVFEDYFDESTLFAEIDSQPVENLTDYWAVSNLFRFTADPAYAEFDQCITGEAQPGLALGYWLLLPPLEPGEHALHFGASSWGQDIAYELTVTE